MSFPASALSVHLSNIASSWVTEESISRRREAMLAWYVRNQFSTMRFII